MRHELSSEDLCFFLFLHCVVRGKLQLVLETIQAPPPPPSRTSVRRVGHLCAYCVPTVWLLFLQPPAPVHFCAQAAPPLCPHV